MKKYRDIFKKKNTLLVVIHAESLAQVEKNLRICYDAEVDGVFLINHSMTAMAINDIFHEVKSIFPIPFIGLNLLRLSAHAAVNLVPVTASGLWVDNAGVREEDLSYAQSNWEFLKTTRKIWDGLYFGGVDFKYHTPEKNLPKISALAKNYMDVVTTSGVATGKAPDIHKIETMRKAIGDFPLAVASGITPENVKNYTDLVDCFLVATGISKSFTELDQKKVQNLVKLLN